MYFIRTLICLLFSILFLLGIAAATQAATLLEFTADWCGPCQQMKPVIQDLRRDGVNVKLVDVDENQAAVQKLNVKKLPCFIVLDDNGKEVARITGVASYHQLRNAYQQKPTPAWRYEQCVGKYAPVVRVIAPAREGIYRGSGCVLRWGKRTLIVTAAHVFRGASKVFIIHKGRSYPCRILGKDTVFDVGVLEPYTPDGLDATEIALGDDIPKIGDQLESCGFGGDDLLAVNSGIVKQWVMPDGSSSHDVMELSGFSRQGDSGGPVLDSKGQLAGTLWGGADGIVTATQSGRLRRIISQYVGPHPIADKPCSQYAKRSQYIHTRPVVPVVPASHQVQQTGLLQDRPKLLPNFCQPRQPTPAPPAPRPNVIVQADPRVGNALQSIDSKLDVVVANTTPPAPENEADAGEASPSPLLAGLCVIGAMIAGFVIYFAMQKD